MIKVVFRKITRKLVLFIINTFLCTTNFFTLKRFLLNNANIVIGDNTKVVGPIHIGTEANLIIGSNCWIGSGLIIYGNGNVKIDSNCDLAPDIAFVTGSHEIGTEFRRAGEGVSFSIRIADGCWIGARVTIVGNVIINSSAIIGTASLVNKDVMLNTIVGGVPAKLIKNI